jgi:hypothetical protein
MRSHCSRHSRQSPLNAQPKKGCALTIQFLELLLRLRLRMRREYCQLADSAIVDAGGMNSIEAAPKKWVAPTAASCRKCPYEGQKRFSRNNDSPKTWVIFRQTILVDLRHWLFRVLRSGCDGRAGTSFSVKPRAARGLSTSRGREGTRSCRFADVLLAKLSGSHRQMSRSILSIVEGPEGNSRYVATLEADVVQFAIAHARELLIGTPRRGGLPYAHQIGSRYRRKPSDACPDPSTKGCDKLTHCLSP